jgi:hypothetical protein
MGDVIVRIESADVASLDEFRKAIAGVDMKHRFLVQARRGDDLKFVLIKPRSSAPHGDAHDTPDAASQVSPPAR